MPLITAESNNPRSPCVISTARDSEGRPLQADCETHAAPAQVGLASGPCAFVRLSETGVPFVLKRSPHFQIRPTAFKVWTSAQEAALIEAARRTALGSTRDLTHVRGRYIETRTVEPGHGLRFYTLSLSSEQNKQET